MEDFLWELQTERFLKGALTPEELRAFEQEQTANSEFKEYVILSIQLQQALSEDIWFSYKHSGKKYDTVKEWYREADVLAFKNKLQQHAEEAFQTKTNVFSLKKYWLPIAAACFILFITLIIQFTGQPTMKELYAEYGTWNDTPSLIVQDQNTPNTKESIELLYKKGDYQQCISLANTFLETAVSDRTNVMIYKGFSFVQLNQHSEALSVFKAIANSETIDASKGLWYMALVYLKMEDIESLHQTLEKIITSDSNYQYATALEILEAIE